MRDKEERYASKLTGWTSEQGMSILEVVLALFVLALFTGMTMMAVTGLDSASLSGTRLGRAAEQAQRVSNLLEGYISSASKNLSPPSGGTDTLSFTGYGPPSSPSSPSSTPTNYTITVSCASAQSPGSITIKTSTKTSTIYLYRDEISCPTGSPFTVVSSSCPNAEVKVDFQVTSTPPGGGGPASAPGSVVRDTIPLVNLCNQEISG